MVYRKSWTFWVTDKELSIAGQEYKYSVTIFYIFSSLQIGNVIQAPINPPCYQVQFHPTLARNLQLNVLLKVNMLKSQINHPTITGIQLRHRIRQKITAFLKRFLVNSIDQSKVYGSDSILGFIMMKVKILFFVIYVLTRMPKET